MTVTSILTVSTRKLIRGRTFSGGQDFCALIVKAAGHNHASRDRSLKVELEVLRLAATNHRLHT
jgi:hypothetical protein